MQTGPDGRQGGRATRWPSGFFRLAVLRQSVQSSFSRSEFEGLKTAVVSVKRAQAAIK